MREQLGWRGVRRRESRERECVPLAAVAPVSGRPPPPQARAADILWPGSVTLWLGGLVGAFLDGRELVEPLLSCGRDKHCVCLWGGGR